MRGQWLGEYRGSESGTAMLNIDAVEKHFEGVAYLKPQDNTRILSAVEFSTRTQKSPQTVTATVLPIDPRSGLPTQLEELRVVFGRDFEHPTKAKLKLAVKGATLRITADTNTKTTLKAVLKRARVSDRSKIEAITLNWRKFKVYISRRSNANRLFRGQRESWSLCTAFHRRGRFRLSTFISQDVRQLHQRLSATTNHFFDLNVPDQNGAFFNLLQHHGYPTPLLDWSHSPYVAAFFALRNWPIGYSGSEKARIYIFNSRAWGKHFPQFQILDPPIPHLSVMEFMAIDNPRLVPQQSVTTVTNLNDIESFILEKEAETGIRFLEAIDIPASERETAIRDLRTMGITAGAMFPSIDGICEELREKNFDR